MPQPDHSRYLVPPSAFNAPRLADDNAKLKHSAAQAAQYAAMIHRIHAPRVPFDVTASDRIFLKTIGVSPDA